MAVGAHLDDVHTDVPEPMSQRRQILSFPDPTRVGPQFVAIHVIQGDQIHRMACRAVLIGRFTVERGRLDEVRIGITEVTTEDAPAMEPSNIRPSLQCVINDRSRCLWVRDRLGWRQRIATSLFCPTRT